MGNVNRDKKVNLLDLIELRKYLAKWNVDIDKSVADCNSDNRIDIQDLIMLRKHLAKWDVYYGVYED